MIEKGKIGIRQFTVLVILFTIGSSILIIPSGIAAEAKQDAWISGIFGVGIGLLLVSFYSNLGNRYPQMTLVEYSERLLGKWVGKGVSLLFVSFTFLLAALVLRNIGDFMTTQIFPETPIESIHIIYFLIIVMGTRLGLEVLARTGEIFLPWVILLFILIIFFLIPQTEMQKLSPILEEGIQPIARGAVAFAGSPFLELVVFLMILPYVNKPKAISKAFLTGTFIGGLILIIIILYTILVIGADLTARQIYPTYILVKKINIGNFLQRLEAMIAGIWFISIFFKLSLCYYASVLGLAQIFELKDYRPLILPLGMVLIVLSIIAYPNIIYFQNFLSTTWTPYALTFGLFLPLFLLGVSYIKQKFNKSS